MQIKRVFLYTIFAALALAALTGICAILGIARSDRVWQGVVSMFAVALCSGVALTAFDVMEKQVWRRLMLAALVADAAALLLYLLLIWLADMFGYGYDETAMKLAGLLAIASIAPPLAGQVMVLRLPRSMNLLRHLSVAVVGAVAVMIAAALVFEIESERYYQLLGILAILMVFAAVALRLAQRVQTLDKQTRAETTGLSLKVVCPRCLLEQTLPSGTSRCGRCRLKFTVEIEEPRCPECGYVLHMLTEPRCPECGSALAPAEIAS